MSLTLEAPTLAPSVIETKKWTRQECERIHDSGVSDLSRFELIKGELVAKMGKNNPHIRAVLFLSTWLRSIFGATHVVTEASIDLRPEDHPTSDPEPDVLLVNQSYFSLDGKARPSDILLIAEVSSSTLYLDLTAKARLYARSAIPEYWVLDLAGRRLIVHRDAQDDAYTSILAYAEDEQVAPLCSPGSLVNIADLLA
jgi:Uma2 family endonuclease